MKTLIVEKNGPIATIWLNRPAVRNAFNADMIDELSAIFEELPLDKDTRLVILAGKGKVFSAGADLNWMKSMVGADEQTNYADSRTLADLLDKVNSCPQAVIGRVHGAALGGGMGLAAVCDIVVADEGAQFGFSEVHLGLIPAVISSFVVAKIGTSWARRYFVSGQRFSAQRAQEVGLVHEIVREEQLEETIENLAKTILSAGPQAIAEAKALLRQVAGAPTEDILKETSEWIARLRVSEEGQEGVAAFLEKRKPKWISK